MRSRTRMIAAAAAVTAALAAGSGAAVASTTGAKSGAPARTLLAGTPPPRPMSAIGKPGGAKAAGSRPADERQAQDAMTAAVAQALHVSTARVSAALRPLFAAGNADTSSAAFAAVARSLGVSAHQLAAALMHAKES